MSAQERERAATATPAFPETPIDAVFGSLRYNGPALSLAEMDAAVASEAKRLAGIQRKSP